MVKKISASFLAITLLTGVFFLVNSLQITQAKSTNDHDQDGIADKKDIDDDNDGYPDKVEKDIFTFDHDNDEIKDKKDDDDDNDDLLDDDEKKKYLFDTDNDGTEDAVENRVLGDEKDADSDNILDVVEQKKYKKNHDNDDEKNEDDTDDDKDCLADDSDTMLKDHDNDGTADNLDDDDDDDGISDMKEEKFKHIYNHDNDTYADCGSGDNMGDTDDDNDGYADAFDPGQEYDHDNDGENDNTDIDDDGDGSPDSDDPQPYDYDNDGTDDSEDADNATNVEARVWYGFMNYRRGYVYDGGLNDTVTDTTTSSLVEARLDEVILNGEVGGFIQTWGHAKSRYEENYTNSRDDSQSYKITGTSEESMPVVLDGTYMVSGGTFDASTGEYTIGISGCVNDDDPDYCNTSVTVSNGNEASAVFVEGGYIGGGSEEGCTQSESDNYAGDSTYCAYYTDTSHSTMVNSFSDSSYDEAGLNGYTSIATDISWSFYRTTCRAFEECSQADSSKPTDNDQPF
ncbi:MAG: hypothetical protein HYV32_05210 [Candidatus Kerfeldbacteria bacterium]|nr:hypothetical protein [Candidatus Kerfeldbacteria bacterium]